MIDREEKRLCAFERRLVHVVDRSADRRMRLGELPEMPSRQRIADELRRKVRSVGGADDVEQE